MREWRWRIALAVIGFVLLTCSACLITTSRLQIERRRERDVVPIQVPPARQAPESHQLLLGTI